MTNIIETALEIAVVAHYSQERKDGLPYITHPVSVAIKLARHGFSPEVIAAGLVHDVLEDTGFNADDLRLRLGDAIYMIVKTLSIDKRYPWKEYKRRYVESVRQGQPEAKVVAIADRIHNLECIISAHQKEGKEVWNLFNGGKENTLWFEKEMFLMLKSNWRHPMIEEYEALIKQVEKLD